MLTVMFSTSDNPRWKIWFRFYPLPFTLFDHHSVVENITKVGALITPKSKPDHHSVVANITKVGAPITPGVNLMASPSILPFSMMMTSWLPLFSGLIILWEIIPTGLVDGF